VGQQPIPAHFKPPLRPSSPKSRKIVNGLILVIPAKAGIFFWDAGEGLEPQYRQAPTDHDRNDFPKFKTFSKLA
jgi:hypothetical protein